MNLGGFDKLMKNLDVLNRDQEDGILQIIESHEPELLDLNIAQMDYEGVDSKGIPLKRYRSAKYAQDKLQLNPRGIVDLHLTGSFHRKMFINASRFPVEFDSSDIKTRHLKEYYGEDIFGLTPKNTQGPAQDILRPSVEDYYREFLVI